MGYSHYMYIVPKKLISDIQNLTYDELVRYCIMNNFPVDENDDGPHVYITDILGNNLLHDFGEYYENAENIYSMGCPLFTNVLTQKEFEDYYPYVVGREALKCAINWYRKKTISYYEKLVMSQEQFLGLKDCTDDMRKTTREQRIDDELECRLRWWNGDYHGMLDMNSDSTHITDSYMYEYIIFELMHQLKTIDWDKNAIAFYGC